MRVPSFKTSSPTRRRGGFRAGALFAALAALLGLAVAASALTTPKLVAVASGTVPVGGTITGTALLGDGANPTGTITFDIYGAGDTKCASQPVFSSTVAVAPEAVSAPYQPTAPGTYEITAAYSGDAANAAVTTACATPGSAVVVTQATPTLTSTASPSVGLGGGISDTAVLSGSFMPTGTVTFDAYGPGDTTCSTPVFSVVEPAGVSTVSAPYQPPTAGVYQFVASYSGDADNAAVAGSCGAAGEAVTVTPASGSGPGSGSAAAQPACSQAVAQTMAESVLAALSAALTGAPGTAFKTTCSSGVRIVLRAKEIRPGDDGYPRHDGFTTIANTLTHSTTTGALTFSLNSQGTALRAYAQKTGQSLTVFEIVHVRPDRSAVSSEAIQILTAG
jgi:hypothetical protein